MFNPIRWYWQSATMPLKIVIAVAVLIIAVLIGRAVIGWFIPAPKLDEAEIQKAQKAIAVEDRKTMVEILTNSAVREQGIDNSIKAAEEAANKAKADYSQLTNEQLAAELEKRINQ